MALIYAEGDCPLADERAKEAAEFLVAAYPNHSWWVDCRQGVLIIKHMEASGQRGQIGMLRHLSSLGADAAQRKKEVLRGAGELLERAYMPRGARTDDPVTKFDGDAAIQKHWHAPLIVPRFH